MSIESSVRIETSRASQSLPLIRGTFVLLQPPFLLCWVVSLLAVLTPQRSTFAQGTPLLELEQAAFERAVTEAAACVVQIETFGGLERIGSETIADGPTSGTIVAPDGWIISSLYSLRQQPASILVSLPNGERKSATIVARDFSRELALLKVEVDEPLPTFAAPKGDATLSPASLVGSWSIALGKTFDKQTPSQSLGIISAVGRAYGRVLQTDAKVSPINYGGPLIDIRGATLGILSPVSPGAFFEGDASQLYDSGIGFAVPIDDVMQRLPKLQAGQDIYPGRLGIVAEDQNEYAGPVVVAGATPGSPAAKAGVQAGDVIVAANGQPVSYLSQLRHALGPVDAEEQFRFRVRRGDTEIDIECQLIQEIPVYRRRFLGLRLAMGEPAGLQVIAVDPDSPASRAGLVAGDVLQSCDAVDLVSLQSLRSKLAVAELDEPLKFTLADDESKSTRTVEVTPVEWPDQLAASMPDKRHLDDEDDAKVTVVDVNVGDFPNKAFALVPSQAMAQPLGLLIVFPEPGELTQQKAEAQWKAFCNDYGWIVAVINSGDPQRWTSEEFELARRVLGRMERGYEIDSARVVIQGLGIGGRIGLVAALSDLERFSGFVAVGTDFGRLRWRRRNAPLQSLDFLLVGNPDSFARTAQLIGDSGFATVVLPAVGVEANRLESLPQIEIQTWLEGLARF